MDSPHIQDQDDDQADGMSPDAQLQAAWRWVLHLDQLEGWHGWRVAVSPETPLLPRPSPESIGSSPSEALQQFVNQLRASSDLRWADAVVAHREALANPEEPDLMTVERVDPLTLGRTSASIGREFFDLIVEEGREKGWL